MEEKKLTFTKFQLFFMDLMVMIVPLLIIKTGTYPDASFLIFWGGWWGLRLILTAVLHVKKKGRKQKYTFFDGIAPYINEENASAIIEKYVGIEPIYNKKNKEAKKSND